jgi:hypothetical protein
MKERFDGILKWITVMYPILFISSAQLDRSGNNIAQDLNAWIFYGEAIEARLLGDFPTMTVLTFAALYILRYIIYGKHIWK